MNESAAREILKDLFSSIGDVETKTTAIMRFMKDKGVASDEELALYLEEAAKATSVRWMAAQARMDYLISSVMETEKGKADSSTAGLSQATTEKEGAEQIGSAGDRKKEGTSPARPATLVEAEGSPTSTGESPSVQAAALKEVGPSATESRDREVRPAEKNSNPGEPAVENAA